jgi:cell division protein FtsA
MENKYIAAIDIGTTKIACLIARVNESNKCELVGMGVSESNGVWCGQVLNISLTVKSIEEALAKAEEQAGVKVSTVSVGIAGKNIRCTQNRGFINKESNDSEFSQEDVEQLIKDQFKTMVHPGEKIIHVLPQDFYIDKTFPTDNPVGMMGKMMEANFHLVICKIDSINNINKCIERVNLETNSIVLEPLASADAVLYDDEKETGVILIDIGGGTTDVAIYNNKMIIHTAVIPFGGNVITNDIKTECGILERHAESLKKQFGEAIADYADVKKVIAVPGPKGREPKEIGVNFLAHLIQSRVEEIIDGVMYEMEISGVANKKGFGIVMTGGGSQLKNLTQLVAFKTGMDVRMGYPNEYIDDNGIKNINNPMYSTAVGLLMKSLEIEIKKGFKTEAKQEKMTTHQEFAKAFEMKANTSTVEETKVETREMSKVLVDEFPTSKRKIKEVKEEKPKKVKTSFFQSYILNLFDGEDNTFES